MAFADLSRSAALGFQAGKGQGQPNAVGGFIRGMLKRGDELRESKQKLQNTITGQATGAMFKAAFAGPKKFQPTTMAEALKFEGKKQELKTATPEGFNEELEIAMGKINEADTETKKVQVFQRFVSAFPEFAIKKSSSLKRLMLPRLGKSEFQTMMESTMELIKLQQGQ